MAAPIAAAAATKIGLKWLPRILGFMAVATVAVVVGGFVLVGAMVSIASAQDETAAGRGIVGLYSIPNAAGWVNPTVGPITSGFGYRADVGLHDGTDIAPACGTPIVAPADGVVFINNNTWDTLGGAWVVAIAHGGGVSTYSAHLIGPGPVGEGGTVAAGQVIGYVGNSGYSSGCHNHHTVRLGGTPVDPVAFYAGLGITLGG